MMGASIPSLPPSWKRHLRTVHLLLIPPNHAVWWKVTTLSLGRHTEVPQRWVQPPLLSFIFSGAVSGLRTFSQSSSTTPAAKSHSPLFPGVWAAMPRDGCKFHFFHVLKEKSQNCAPSLKSTEPCWLLGATHLFSLFLEAHRHPNNADCLSSLYKVIQE